MASRSSPAEPHVPLALTTPLQATRPSPSPRAHVRTARAGCPRQLRAERGAFHLQWVLPTPSGEAGPTPRRGEGPGPGRLARPAAAGRRRPRRGWAGTARGSSKCGGSPARGTPPPYSVERGGRGEGEGAAPQSRRAPVKRGRRGEGARGAAPLHGRLGRGARRPDWQAGGRVGGGRRRRANDGGHARRAPPNPVSCAAGKLPPGPPLGKGRSFCCAVQVAGVREQTGGVQVVGAPVGYQGRGAALPADVDVGHRRPPGRAGGRGRAVQRQRRPPPQGWRRRAAARSSRAAALTARQRTRARRPARRCSAAAPTRAARRTRARRRGRRRRRCGRPRRGCERACRRRRPWRTR
jgi:hypothetical protein